MSCTRACRSVRKPQGSCIPSCRMRGNAHREPTAFAGAAHEGCTSGVSSAIIVLLLTSLRKASPSESPTSMANKTPAATSTTIIASLVSSRGQKNLRFYLAGEAVVFRPLFRILPICCDPPALLWRCAMPPPGLRGVRWVLFLAAVPFAASFSSTLLPRSHARTAGTHRLAMQQDGEEPVSEGFILRGRRDGRPVVNRAIRTPAERRLHPDSPPRLNPHISAQPPLTGRRPSRSVAEAMSPSASRSEALTGRSRVRRDAMGVPMQTGFSNTGPNSKSRSQQQVLQDAAGLLDEMDAGAIAGMERDANPLPPFWREEFRAGSNRPFYRNTKTGVTTWKRPKIDAVPSPPDHTPVHCTRDGIPQHTATRSQPS